MKELKENYKRFIWGNLVIPKSDNNITVSKRSNQYNISIKVILIFTFF